MIRVFVLLGLSLFTLTVPQPAVAVAATTVQTSDPAFISHKVVPGETLYSISRKYGVSVAELTKYNPAVKNGLRSGQTLRVPNKKTGAAASENAPKATVPAKTETVKSEPKVEAASVKEVPAGGKMHKVGPRETLYSVAIKNKVTMAEIRKWNNLKTDKLALGQVLLVSAPASTQETVAAPIKTETEEPTKTIVTKSETKTKGDKVKTETKTETVKTEIPEENAKDKEEENAETATVVSAGKVTETGLAEVIAGENNKFLALHKTAPVGTILQVKNIMNGQTVYVRVIGKLPDTGINEKVIVRISKKAYQRLAALDNRFRVEVSYMP